MGLKTIIFAISSAIRQLDDPKFLRVVILGVLAALVFLFAFAFIISFVLGLIFSNGLNLPIIGEISFNGWLAGGVGFAAMTILSVFLMVPVASAISSLFIEQVAQAVEDRHYPALAPAKSYSIAQNLSDTFGFLGVLILANLCALIFYLIFAPLAPIIFWALNGYLLAREYYFMVAKRREPHDTVKRLWRKNRLKLWLGGIAMVAPLSIPIVNLFIPVLGAAAFTHLFHQSWAAPSDQTSQYRAPL